MFLWFLHTSLQKLSCKEKKNLLGARRQVCSLSNKILKLKCRTVFWYLCLYVMHCHTESLTCHWNWKHPGISGDNSYCTTVSSSLFSFSKAMHQMASTIRQWQVWFYILLPTTSHSMPYHLRLRQCSSVTRLLPLTPTDWWAAHPAFIALLHCGRKASKLTISNCILVSFLEEKRWCHPQRCKDRNFCGLLNINTWISATETKAIKANNPS